MHSSLEPRRVAKSAANGRRRGSTPVDWVDWRFLVRWWVNSQPYVPRPLAAAEFRRSGDHLLSYGLRFHVDLDPARIGARSGDRVGVQLLYSASGWTPMGRPDDRLRGAALESAFDSSLLSNRVEFIVP